MRAVLMLCALFFQGSLGDLVVQLPSGKVEGTSFDTLSGRPFYAWRGIPYAKPPVAQLRYLPPVRGEPWEGTLDASEDSPACVSFGEFVSDPKPLKGTSEDCLYINVYSPVPVGSNTSVNATRSVMFWIYGEGFYGGFSDFGFYDPTPFLEEDVIVVTFNYRLGPLGFLSTQDEVILGNAGLKDQRLALIWTRENIGFFGGNPFDVTIFGESAGAVSVGYHIISPLSRNLFKGAIMQSGNALLSSSLPRNARDFALDLARQIDSSITDLSTSEKIRDVLQAAPVELLQDLAYKRADVVLEVKSNLSFLTEPFYETLESGDIARVPILIGYNSEEQIGFGNYTEPYELMALILDSDPAYLVPFSLKLKEGVSFETVGALVHQHYVGQDGFLYKNLVAYFEYSSDDFMTRSTTKHALLQSRFSPVYMYQFSYYGTLSKYNLIVPGAGKVAHAQEVGYLFNISTRHIETEKDYLTRRRFVKLWTNFAKTSNPTPDDDSAELLQNVKWEPITEDNVQYLDIDDNLQLKPSRKTKETALYDYIWETFSYRPYNTY